MTTTDSYHGTRGHGPAATSTDAAIAERDKGITNAMMQAVLAEIHSFGNHGLTSAELRGRPRLAEEHHGRISSAITKLHIAGEVVALRERRGNCGVYVHPDYVGDRDTRPYRRQAVRLSAGEIFEILQAHQAGAGGCTCGLTGIFWQRELHRHVSQVIAAAIRGEDVTTTTEGA